MTSGMEALTQAQHKVAEALYKQAGARAAPRRRVSRRAPTPAANAAGRG